MKREGKGGLDKGILQPKDRHKYHGEVYASNQIPRLMPLWDT